MRLCLCNIHMNKLEYFEGPRDIIFAELGEIFVKPHDHERNPDGIAQTKL